MCWPPAAAPTPRTTRIETRPFYGATVTLEEGVRVFRPLPRHDRVIINPGGKTPLSLGFGESCNYSYNHYTAWRRRRRPRALCAGSTTAASATVASARTAWPASSRRPVAATARGLECAEPVAAL